MQVIPVLLSGGSGTRLWPLSRHDRPKQFLDLGLGSSLFHQTLERCSGPGFSNRPIIVGSINHRYLIAEELAKADREADVLLEPEGRNSCAAIAAACAFIRQHREEALVLAVACDQMIADEFAFSRSVAQGIDAAAEGRLVVFGITPTRADPGFGYIRYKEGPDIVHPVSRFSEKPDVAAAHSMVLEGWVWNSGSFLFRAEVAMQEIDQFEPRLAKLVRQSINNGRCSTFLPEGEAHQWIELSEDAFCAIKPISFDHAVMEHTARASVVPTDYQLEDLGCWEAYSEGFGRDVSNNRLSGMVRADDSANNVVHSQDRLTTLLGVRDLIVVNTRDALLVADRSRADELSGFVETLKSDGVIQAEAGHRIVSPWGSHDSLVTGSGYHIKRLNVTPGASLSMQTHEHRAEYWIVLEGQGEAQIDNTASRINAGDSIHVPQGSRHRLSNVGTEPLVIIEVQTGDYFGEDDIVRLEDDYDRV